MSENKRYIRFIDNYEDVYIKTPTKQKIEIGWEDDVFVGSIDEVVDLLNEQDKSIKYLNASDVAKLLNEFHEENEQLKQEVENLHEQLVYFLGDSE